ncbi:MAG: hypothetical protein M3O28_15460 [Actinomycetota bacterium]|nr:hypothetical protein [Actinomycetota bacterium]
MTAAVDKYAPAERVQLFSAAPSGPVRWRVLSGNNRELGRGLGLFVDAEKCRIAVKELQVSMTALVPRIRPVSPNEWVWELRRDGVPVAAAGHAFDRLIRCERGLSQFVDRFADAPIAAALMISDARRWVRGAR